MSTLAVEVGTVLPALTVRLTRETLVRYAGASGDFNPIHYSDHAATALGLPGVIAHGMLTMALAGRLVTQWAGDPAAVRSYGVRFTRPVVVPDDDEGALVEISGKVRDVTDGVATVAITAVFDGKTVLGRAQAEVVLPG